MVAFTAQKMGPTLLKANCILDDFWTILGGRTDGLLALFRPLWLLNPLKMISKVVLEVLLDVPEEPLEVLDLSWRPWRWFWTSIYYKSHVIENPMY